MNIEEDIKILKDKAKALNEHIKNYEESNCTGSDVYRAIKEEKEAIGNVLADRERLEKENNTLAVENFRLNTKLQTNRKEYQETYKDVREEIKELQTKANKYDALVENVKNEVKELEVPILIYGGRGNGKTYARAEKEAKKYVLKYILELLEEEEV